VRELKEETGLVIGSLEILGTFMDVYGPEQESTLTICYTAKVIGGRRKVGSDAAEAKWFPVDALPDDIAFQWSTKALGLLQSRLGFNDSQPAGEAIGA
jgi:ADP-ribose pyrophosphatase YjhB (NUDIX family)